jgi:hypothetical protein
MRNGVHFGGTEQLHDGWDEGEGLRLSDHHSESLFRFSYEDQRFRERVPSPPPCRRRGEGDNLYVSIMPRRMAITTASVRSLALILARMLFMCVFTVSTEMPIWVAMRLLEKPPAT